MGKISRLTGKRAGKSSVDINGRGPKSTATPHTPGGATPKPAIGGGMGKKKMPVRPRY